MVELAGYLSNEAGPVPLVLDLRIAHDRVGPLYGCSDPGDCEEAARDLRLQEISVRPLRGSP